MDNCAVEFTQPVEDGTELDSDLWLLSDINAEKATDHIGHLNRPAYHASVVHITHAIQAEKALVLGLKGLSDLGNSEVIFTPHRWCCAFRYPVLGLKVGCLRRAR